MPQFENVNFCVSLKCTHDTKLRRLALGSSWCVCVTCPLLHVKRSLLMSLKHKHSKKGKFSHSSLSSTEEEFKGILRNLELVEKYYSDYVMRLYTDITEEDESSKHSALCDIYCNHPKLDICDVHNLGRRLSYYVLVFS